MVRASSNCSISKYQEIIWLQKFVSPRAPPAGSAQRSQRHRWTAVIGGAATGRKPEAVTKTPGSLDNLLPVAVDVAPKDHVELAALLPAITVVFTVGGPVVYERGSDQFA